VNKRTLDAVWDQTRQKYGVFLRLVDTIPEAELHGHPVPGMRTPAELVAHVSGGIVRDIASGIASGAIRQKDNEAAIAKSFKTKADALAYARKCWTEADATAAKLTDKELGAIVNAWGMQLPGSACVNILNDELVHHRGQLYTYARALGAEPPFVWSHGDNAAEFAPKA
jgi:uncharacterized damage-inducible protein DinB